MTLLEDLPHFSLWHDSSCACLCATWHGYQSGELMRIEYGLIRWHLQATRSTKLLNDSLLDEDGWQELIGWLANDCFQLLVEEGLEVVAWVLPRHSGSLFDTIQVLIRLHQLQPALVDTFSDVQAAHAWLQRWPNTSVGPIPPTVAAFLALPQVQQVALAEQQGQPLAPRWEAELYVDTYLLGNTLRVEISYYIYSGLLHRVCAYLVCSPLNKPLVSKS